jgi:hypothetical protein
MEAWIGIQGRLLRVTGESEIKVGNGICVGDSEKIGLDKYITTQSRLQGLKFGV